MITELTQFINLNHPQDFLSGGLPSCPGPSVPDNALILAGPHVPSYFLGQT